MSISSHLVHTPSSYCFRLAVPVDLRCLVGKTEIRYSLKTGSKSEAKPKAHQIAVQCQKLFRKLRNKANDMPQELTPEQIQELIRCFVAESLAIEDDYRFEVGVIDRQELDHRVEGFGDVLQNYRESLALRNYVSAVGDSVDSLLKSRGISLDKSSRSYATLCKETLQAGIKWLEVEIQKEIGHFGSPQEVELLASIQKPSEPTPMQEVSIAPPSELLKAVVDQYFDENIKAGNWGVRTIPEYKNQFRLLTDFLGAETPVNAITIQRMQEYKKLLNTIPKGFYKAKQYEGMSLEDVPSLSGVDLMSTTTINKYLTNAEAMFSFAVRNGYLDKNPAEGHKIRQKRNSPDEQRDSFSKEDLSRLFCSDKYIQDEHSKPYQYWMPLLALFTGCRLEELAQLHVDDVKQESGVWFLSINEEGEKRIKNTASKRLIPLHPVLTEELNFPGYVDSVIAKGSIRVFPELIKVQNCYGHAVTKWFKAYKESCGIESELGKKVFHSFRHTLINHLKEKSLPEYMVSQVSGHSVDGMAMGRYGKKVNPEILLNEVIQKLDYGIDFNHLKGSRYNRR